MIEMLWIVPLVMGMVAFRQPAGEEKVLHYRTASLAAATGVVKRPKKFPILEGIRCHGTTGIHIDFHFDGDSHPDIAVPSFDMPVETDELMQVQDIYVPVNLEMSEGESLDILGSSLTLGTDHDILFRFRKQKSGPTIGIKRFTYTNTTDPEELGTMPVDAQDVLAMLCRGTDLEASKISFGEDNPSFLKGQQCSALNDILIAPIFQEVFIPRVGGDVVTHHESEEGTGGAAELFVAYTRKSRR